MKTNFLMKIVIILLIYGSFTSCEDFLEIEAPDHKITNKVVFDNDETAKSAMIGIYNRLTSEAFSGGASSSVTVLNGLSADDLTTLRNTNLPFVEFDQNEILPNNFRNLQLWASAFNIIYMTNALLEGLENSNMLTGEVHNQLEGEAKFVRAFTYFYLVNLYGDVPLILTTDYRANAVAGRMDSEEIYNQIISDLETSISLLNTNFPLGERTSVNRYTAIGLLARVQLYIRNWENAENLSSQVINQNGTYEILQDLDQVFLANSQEAIWQLSPKSRGNNLTHTNEGATFIIHPVLSFLSNFKLPEDFVATLDTTDHRLTHWIGFHGRTESYYPSKYKIRSSTDDFSEYSMVLRLAEQFLIRSEARAMQGNLLGAIEDLDKIRSRAGIELIADINPEVNKEDLLNLIIEERRKELFTEWGHRWLDLKRIGKAGEVFGNNPLWQNTDDFYPIPEEERIKNPNLSQNNGY